MTKAELYQKACMLPLLPGVYIIRDKSDTIIYIGKAKRLRIRVSQYFREGPERVRGAGAGSQPDQGAHPQIQYPAEG